MGAPRSIRSEPCGIQVPKVTQTALEHGLVLTIGALAIRVTSWDRAWFEQALQRYGAFARPLGDTTSLDPVLDGESQWELHYEVRGGAVSTPEDLCQARRHGLHAGPDSTWTGRDFAARWRPSTGRVEVIGPPAIYPLDLLLQALWYSSRPDSLIVHAAALQDGRRGWLFAGPSGIGKSTLVSLCAEHAMGDELVAVEARSDGFDLVALPFWRAQPGRYPLAAVCCLQHRATGVEAPHARRRLTQADALARLRGQVSWPTWDASAMVTCLEVLGRLIESMPVDELAFTPQPDVWEFLASNPGVDPEGAER